MPVGDEDVAVRRDQNIGRRIEGVGTVARHTSLAQRHQDLAVGTELVDLMTLGALAPAVGDPHIAIPVDVEAVGKDKHPGAEAFRHVTGWIDLEDWRHVRAVAARAAAALEHPDALAVAIDIDADRLSPFAPVWKLGPILDRAIRIGRVASLRVGARLRHDDRRDQGDAEHPPNTVLHVTSSRHAGAVAAPRLVFMRAPKPGHAVAALPPRQFLLYFISRLGPTSAP